MIRLLLLQCCLFFCVDTMAATIIVKNLDELNAANKKAQPGDIIILQNGEWKDATIRLNCHGTKEKPVVFKAQTAGKVMITGKSQLRLGGNFIVIDGLYFTNGYAGKDPVINFRIDKDQLANNCRVTNTVINDFNNPKRMDENYWVAFYGKNNRLDHCSFKDKKNIGVLLAVILDDERNRENFHSIDHNYFGRRPALASNGGEIIRVGVSQHCQFNSNTQISNNFFEYCDGETEIVSIKSGSNTVKENVFKECQGSVVLRHGDNNLVTGNYFLGNDKAGSGGVRIINKGQKVNNNIFFKCRGIDFRSPMAIMNGIPNSPAHRYVQVTDAEIINNTFYECTPVTFCEGSDTERTLPPDNVIFSNNTFYNSKDSIIYKVYDDISGIKFGKNIVSRKIKQVVINGFEKTIIPKQKPIVIRKGAESGPPHVNIIPLIEKESYSSSGAVWFSKKEAFKEIKPLVIDCLTTEDIYKQLKREEPVIIRLTGKNYTLTNPLIISKQVQFTGDKINQVQFTTENIFSVFLIAGKGNLILNNLTINGEATKATHLIASDSSGSSQHYNLSVRNCSIQNLSRKNGCENLFYAYKYMVADSIVFQNNSLVNNDNNGIMMTEEKDNKGYYNAEKINISNNHFSNQGGTLLNIYRGGNDESTMGPLLILSNNTVSGCNTVNEEALIKLTGTQSSLIGRNSFINCNPGKVLLHFEDVVRAIHLFKNNAIKNSGKIIENKFVQQTNNVIQ